MLTIKYTGPRIEVDTTKIGPSLRSLMPDADWCMPHEEAGVLNNANSSMEGVFVCEGMKVYLGSYADEDFLWLNASVSNEDNRAIEVTVDTTIGGLLGYGRTEDYTAEEFIVAIAGLLNEKLDSLR